MPTSWLLVETPKWPSACKPKQLLPAPPNRTSVKAVIASRIAGRAIVVNEDLP
jgi:hypothetical protein